MGKAGTRRQTQETPEVGKAIFLSDVHLSADRPDLTRGFHAFLESLRGDTTHLYILGDLFDYWMGPAHMQDPEHRATLDQLRELTRTGMEVHFVHGNRDFHVSREFSRATGVRVMGDGEAAVFGPERVWLTHGDLLCTDDVDYHVWRRIARARWAVGLYRALPHWLTRAIARRARAVSARKGLRLERGRGLTREGVRRVMLQGYDRIICGHVHEARTTSIDLPGRTGTLMVLGEWNGTGSVIEWDGESFRHRMVDLAAGPR